MNDEQLLRYSRQIMLPEFDYQGQQRLLSARVLIIGLGGLGSPVAFYLASAGVGTLVLADDDVVDESNLQRQIIHGEADVGINKCLSAKASLEQMNSDIKIHVIQKRLELDNYLELIESLDLVLDCTDNLASRNTLNKACYQLGKPLVSGAAIRMEGQLICIVRLKNQLVMPV